MKTKIYPTLTSTEKGNIDKYVKEINSLKIKEICLFLTGLEKTERKELYRKLEETCLEKIPFVHLRSDMNSEELKYLIGKYKTKIFNIHSEKQYPLENDLSKYIKQIYIENIFSELDEKEIQKFAGICIDFSHLEKMRLISPDIYNHNLEIINKYPFGCAHISAFKSLDNPVTNHFAEQKSDFDYLKRYKPLFPEICAIELENSISDQLSFIDYIYSII